MPSVRARAVLDYIGANLRRGRERAGLTQEQLAAAANVDTRFLQRVERGGTNISAVMIVALAEALGVTPGSLFKPARVPEVRRGRPPGRFRQARAKK